MSKSIRDRVALVKRLREMKGDDGREVTSSQDVQTMGMTQEFTMEHRETGSDKKVTIEKEGKEDEGQTLLAVSRQNSSEPKYALDIIQRLESVSNSNTPSMGNSPHATLDEEVSQEYEKVQQLGIVDLTDIFIKMLIMII